MRVRRIHHVAFAHPGGSPILDAASDLLGLECAHAESAADFVERMLPTGEGFLQLLEATGDGDAGVVSRFVDKRGPGLHHIAFEVDDVDAAVRELKAKGVKMVDETPRPGGMGTRIAFVHPSAFGGLLVELVEDPHPTAPSDPAVEATT